MAPRRKRAVTRRRKFKGLRVIDTGTDLFTANALVTGFMGQGIYGAFLQPFINAGTYEKYQTHSKDHALDIRELAEGLMGRWKAGTGGRYSGGSEPWFGPGWENGPAGVMMSNITSNIVPTVIKVVGAGVAKKVLKKTVAKPLNKLTRQIGMADLVRW
jgi:hypothetical protein